MTGVYCILNTLDGKRYVGSSAVSVPNRLKHHKWQLRRNRHINRYLQNAWNKYGEEVFKFVTLFRCSPCDVLKHEQRYMDRYNTYDRKCGYNRRPVSGNQLGFRHSKKSLFKMSKAHKGKFPSAETRAKYSAALRKRVTTEKTRQIRSQNAKGNKNSLGRKLPPEHIAKLIHSNKSRIITDEYRQRLSDSHKGHIASEETRRKMSLAQQNRKPVSDETRQKMRDSHKTRRANGVYAKIAKTWVGRKHSLASRLKMSISARNRREKQTN